MKEFIMQYSKDVAQELTAEQIVLNMTGRCIGFGTCDFSFLSFFPFRCSVQRKI